MVNTDQINKEEIHSEREKMEEEERTGKKRTKAIEELKGEDSKIRKENTSNSTSNQFSLRMQSGNESILSNPFSEILKETSLQSIRSLFTKRPSESELQVQSSESEVVLELIPFDKLKEPESLSSLLYTVMLYLTPQSKRLSQESSWKDDMHFFDNSRILAKYYPDFLSTLLPMISEKLCELCNSLQSAVMKGALITIADLVDCLGVSKIKGLIVQEKSMVLHKQVLSVVLKKASLDKRFIREECTRVLEIVFVNTFM